MSYLVVQCTRREGCLHGMLARPERPLWKTVIMRLGLDKTSKHILGRCQHYWRRTQRSELTKCSLVAQPMTVPKIKKTNIDSDASVSASIPNELLFHEGCWDVCVGDLLPACIWLSCVQLTAYGLLAWSSCSNLYAGE